MTEDTIAKALEIWTLQTLLNISIMFGILACGLAMAQAYYRSLEKHLSLRVSLELWRIFTVVVADICLVFVVLVGYLVLNPDIMSDIKMAIPFCPIATILFAMALVLRLFRGGHDLTSKNYLRSLRLMFAANLANVIGFSFVMEAPGEEYMKRHAEPFWVYIKENLRSNADPHGIDLAQITFYICFPILLAVALWGIQSALAQLQGAKEQ